MTDSGWREITLGEVLQVKHGFAFRGEFFTKSGDHIVVTPGNFIESGGFKRIVGKEKWYSGGPVPHDYMLLCGDIVIPMTEQSAGLLGATAIIPESGTYLHNQRIGRLQIGDSAVRGFVYYLFNSAAVRQQIAATATGAKVRHTAPERVHSVRVRIPHLDTQRKIAAILSAYDDLIESNRRRIDILESLALAVYDEWFVQGRVPLRTLEVGKGEDSKLVDLATISRGKSYRSVDLEPGHMPFITLKSVRRGGGYQRRGMKSYSGKFKDAHLVKDGDIVVAVTDMTQERSVVGHPARIHGLRGSNGVISMDLVSVKSHDPDLKEWLYYALLDQKSVDVLRGAAVGTNVVHLHPEHIASLSLRVPSRKATTEFAQVVGPSMRQAAALETESQNLAAQRDLLLPKLIAGELDVSELDIDTSRIERQEELWRESTSI